jgi:protein gp37
MPMNKSKGNMYPWVTHLWNPVKGKCAYECSYCYVARIHKRVNKEQKPLNIYFTETDINLGNFRTIFVCSGCDLFHPDVPDWWIEHIGQRAFDYGSNRYILHTKNPERAANFFADFPIDTVLCATIESNIPWPGISKAPQPFERITGLRKWRGPKMITIEPIMDFDVTTFSEMILSCKPERVNIGADSGNNHLPEPPPEKIAALIGALRENNIEVYLKKNIKRLYKEDEN